MQQFINYILYINISLQKNNFTNNIHCIFLLIVFRSISWFRFRFRFRLRLYPFVVISTRLLPSNILKQDVTDDVELSLTLSRIPFCREIVKGVHSTSTSTLSLPRGWNHPRESLVHIYSRRTLSTFVACPKHTCN